MAWKEIRMRGGSKDELVRKMYEVKEMLCDICEELEDMDEMSERGGRWSARGEYGERGMYEHDEEMGERRRRR